ncbi:MAG: hypothetical protein ACE37K_05170 [Planctomycetota bacterium]
MTNQLQGQILYTGVTAVYTPWMPVRGDFATFGVEVLENSSASLTWQVETRTKESVTPSTLLATAVTFTSGQSGVKVAVNDDSTNTMQELVRYKFSTGGTKGTTNFVMFRALQPSWRTDR